MPDTGNSWNDHHKWNNRQNRSRSVHAWLLYRVAKKSLTCILLQKSCFENFSKFQLIWATAMESISRKGSFLWLLNVLWERTLPQLFFYTATLISLKLKKFPVYGNSFSIHGLGEIFPFINDLMICKYIQMHKEGCSCAA